MTIEKSALVFALLAMLLLPFASRAAQVPLTMEQLTAIADQVVSVRVDSKETVFYRGKIFTTAKFDVVETFKGDLSGSQKISYLGGRKGKLVMAAPNQPDLSKGDEVVLFLSKPLERLPKSRKDEFDPKSPMVNSYLVVGGDLGKFEITGGKIADKQKSSRKGDDPIPTNAKVVRKISGLEKRVKQPAPSYGEFKQGLYKLVANQKQAEKTKIAPRKIPGVYGEFVVAPKSDDPLIRAYDPLPEIAYKTDAELAEIKALVSQQAKQAEKNRKEKEESGESSDSAEDASK